MSYTYGGFVISTYQTEDNRNHKLLYEKWLDPKKCRGKSPNILDFSQHKKRIAIWTGPAWEPWDRGKVDEGMAGSETWAAYIAREFVRRGFETTVYNHLPDDKKEEVILDPVEDVGEDCPRAVRYRDHTQMMKDIQYQYIDYFISSRSTEPLRVSLHAGRHYVMIHDIWISGDKNYDIVSWKTQGYAYLSEWHKRFLIEHHKIPAEKMFLTANGVVQELYQDLDSYEKKNQMVYSSSPDRGLYQLLQMLPEIRKGVPDFQLLIAYGFYNWESAAKTRGDKQSLALIAKIKKLIEQQSGIVYLDRISKKELAEHQKESKVWLYPTWFQETFCVGAVENGLCRNALLATDIAGLKTTVGDAGILLPPKGLSRDGEYPREFQEMFVQKSIDFLTNEDLRRAWASRAYEKMQAYRWNKIVDGWLKQFTGVSTEEVGHE